MKEEKPPVPKKILEERLREIDKGEYITLRELETRILKKIASKTHT